jgi:predicted phage terminase large subunit-like protein
MDILTRKAQTEHFRQSFGVELPRESQVDEVYETARENARKNLYYFTKAVLGWDLLQPDPHESVCNFIQKIPRSRKVILIPRDCYKSTVGSKSLPLWILIQKEFMGIPGPEHRILLSSFSSTNAVKQVRSIKQQIERNDTLRWLFPELIPDLQKTTWSNTNLLFNREGLYGEDTIETAGLDTHIVSRHYTVQIADDIEDKESFESPTVRERVKTAYRASEALFVDEQTAYHLLIGTRWGVDDVYSEIHRNEQPDYEFHVRPLKWTREDIERDHELSKEDGEPPIWNMDPREHAPDSEKTYYFFPKLFPEASCRRIERKQGTFMFAMLYLNNPRDPSTTEFKEEDFRDFVFDADGDLVIENEQGSREVVRFEELKRVLMWDPAAGSKKKANNRLSRNAQIVGAMDRKNRLFILDAHAERKNPLYLFQRFIGMHQRYRCTVAAIEDVNFQRILKFPLYKVMRDMEYTFPIQDFTPVGDKDHRIRSLIPYAESHSLFVRKGLKDFKREMRGFPALVEKDLLDACAATLKLFGTAVEIPKSGGARIHSMKRERERLATRNATTGY